MMLYIQIERGHLDGYPRIISPVGIVVSLQECANLLRVYDSSWGEKVASCGIQRAWGKTCHSGV